MEVLCEPAVYVKAKQSRATLQLTRLDQLRNHSCACILFYPSGVDEAHGEVGSREGNKVAVLQAVRRGVEAMVEHYPWAAGRIDFVKQSRISPTDGEEEEEELLEVYINEDGGPGVQLVEASVNVSLQSLGDLSDPNPAFDPLFARIDEKAPFHSRPIVALQVSRFECGGFSVAVTNNHALFDGVGLAIFLQNLGSCARGESLYMPIDLSPRKQRISPRNPPAPTSPCAYNVVSKASVEQNVVLGPLPVKKHVFTESDIAELRLHALAKQDDCKKGFRKCSRYEVLTAHLWRAKARCRKALCGADGTEEFSVHVAVNVRERIMVGIPKGYVGNALGVARPCATIMELTEKSLAFAVEAIQEAIERVTPEAFQSDVDHLEILGNNVCMLRPSMTIPYLSNLGFYDVDFGWGKPIGFAVECRQAHNRVVIKRGNAQSTSLIAYAGFLSEDESLIFQDALKCKFVD